MPPLHMLKAAQQRRRDERRASKQGRTYMIGILGVAKVLLLQSEKAGEWNLIVGQEKLTEEVGGAVDRSAERV